MTRSRSNPGKWTPLLVVLAMVMAACGGSDTSSEASTTAATEPVESTTTAAEVTTTAGEETTTTAAEEVEPIALRYVQQSPSMAYLPGQLAQGAGFFEEEGIALEALAPSAESLQLVISGDTDIGTASSPQLFTAIAEGRPVTALGVLTPNSTNELILGNEAIAALAEQGVTPESPIEERVAALEGMTLTVPAEGTSSNLSLRSTLEEYGLDPDRDVNLIPTPDAAANITTTREGRADGYMHSPPVTSIAVAEGFGQVWFSYFKGDVPLIEGINLIQIVARTDWVEENPEAVTRFMRALWRAHDLLVNDPDAAAAALNQFFENTDPEVYDVAFTAMREVYLDGLLPTEEGFERTLALVESQVGRDIDITYDQVYTDEFVFETMP